MSDKTDAAEMSDMWTRFARVLCNVESLKKDQKASINATFSYRYADINSVLAMLKPVLLSWNMAVAQPVDTVDGNNTITTMLICNVTGDRLQFPGPSFPVKGDPQAAGSAITYFRRYALVSLFGLESEDDDGAIAHRAATTPNGRTAAETVIRQGMNSWDKPQVKAFTEAFTEQFGCGLSALPEGRHGDALTFWKAWDNK